MGRKLRDSAGFILLIALIYAPWALGCVKPWGVTGLTALCLTGGGLCGLGCLLDRRTNVPRWCAGCAAGLLILGWWMICNAHGVYQSDGHVEQVRSWWPAAAGAVDGPVCAQMMWQITGVLVALLVACDLAAQELWRWRIVTTIAATGVCISAYGLLQKAALVPVLADSQNADSVFATFDYRGSAGAYLNLVIPAAFVLAVRWRRMIGWILPLICLAAVLTNVSRTAMLISFLLIFALSGLTAVPRRWLLAGVAAAAIVATVVGGGAAWQRWGEMPIQATHNNPRLLVLQITLPMAAKAGWMGDGPGSYKLIYFNSPNVPTELYPRWIVEPYQLGTEASLFSYAQNDYLQFAIEWGHAGAALWACLLGGGVLAGLTAFKKCLAEQRLILIAAMTGLAGILTHALLSWPLQVAPLQLYTAVYLGLLYSNPPCAFC